MSIRFNLKNLLKERNMTQAELSRITGIRIPTIGYMYRNSKNIKYISLKNIDKICNTLSCSPADLLKYRQKKDVIKK